MTKRNSSTLKIVSWNARGIKRQLGMVYEFLNEYDIICLQETWLRAYESNILEKLFPDSKSAIHDDEL